MRAAPFVAGVRGAGWGREAGAPSPLGSGYVAELVLPVAVRTDETRGCPPRREGARRDAPLRRRYGFYSLVHSGFCFSMNAFMPIFWSLVEKVE